MVVGEPQILGQLKAAYAAAKDCGALCGWLDGLLTRAFSVAKRVRSETGIGQMAVSVSYAAVELARKIFGSLEQPHRHDRGRRQDVANWPRATCAAPAPRTSSSPTAPTSAPSRWPSCSRARRSSTRASSRMLPEVDIVIAARGAPHYILHKDEMQRVIAARRNKPMFLIDIAVPRNIEPSVNELDNVFLYDIDDLQEVVNANLRERMKEAEHAEAMVDRGSGAHDGAAQGGGGHAHHRRACRSSSSRSAPAEIEKVRRKLGPLTPRAGSRRSKR